METALIDSLAIDEKTLLEAEAGRATIKPLFFPPYQVGFLGTTARYPAMVSSIGTGKTRMAVQKIFKYCDEVPNSLWIVIRKEFTDLRDSTMPDFEKYFNVKINSQRNYDYPNGSRIMFRHGEEIEHGGDAPNVLKNLNLSGFMIEQAEEFLTDKTFQFLRDRLRRQDMPYHQGIIIANVCGHNWIYKIWKCHQNSDPEKYPLFEANTFDNAANLPKEFLDDLRSMETEAPAHYRRYVLNDWDEEEGVDILITRKFIEESFGIEGIATGGKGLSCDPARSESKTAAETAICIVQRIDEERFAQTHGEAHKGWDTMQTVGRIMNILSQAPGEFDWVLIDGNGLGGGVYDRLREMKTVENKELLKDVVLIDYNSGSTENVDTKKYGNTRAEDTWLLKKMVEGKKFRLLNDEKQTDQIVTLQFRYRSSGARYILSKEEMASKGLPSPDRADRIIMTMKHLNSLRAARPQLSPSEINRIAFWDMVNADKAKTQNLDGDFRDV